MKKVNLDEEFDNWKIRNNKYLLNLFLDLYQDEFDEIVEKEWREYQEDNGLIDISNESIKEE